MKAAQKLKQAIDKNDLNCVTAILKAEGGAAKELCLCEVPPGGNAVHHAASVGHVDIVRAILDTGVDVNSRRSEGDAVLGMTALHGALGESHTDTVCLLLQKGADVNVQDGNGISPLHIACRENSVDMVQELLDAGAHINVKGNRGYTPLLVSIMRSAVDCSLLLIDRGADVQQTDKEGSSPLHYAAEWECVNVIEALISKGADLNLQDQDGNTPLHVSSDDDVFDLLVKHGADQTIRNNNGRLARDQRLDMDKEEFININKALGQHTEKMASRSAHGTGLQHSSLSRIFSPGPPVPEAELRTARSNMLKELQKRTGFEGAPPLAGGQQKMTPRTPRATGHQVVSPLAKEALGNLNSQLAKATVSNK